MDEPKSAPETPAVPQIALKPEKPPEAAAPAAPAAVLGRAEILQLNLRPKKVEPLDVPGYGRVFVKVVSGRDLDSYETGNYREDPKTGKLKYDTSNARARWFVRTVCDDKGNRLFADGDADFLGGFDAIFLDAVWDKSRKLNKRTPEEEEALEKNSSPPAATGSSGTDSPAP